MTQTDKNYSIHYSGSANVYPPEFLVRALLGSYPKHKLVRDYSGKAVLDLGFGDGRCFGLLNDLGMRLHGVEVTEDICSQAKSKFSSLNIDVDIKVGRNSNIPYDDKTFDYVVASSSCYYMDEEGDYSSHVDEMARVLKPGGKLIHTLPMSSTFIMNNAIDLGDGHMRITEDPYGVRVGARLKMFRSEDEIKSYLDDKFNSISIATQQDCWWGENVHLWVVACERR